MKKTITVTVCIISLLISFGQESKYDHKEAFKADFYPYPGNEFRSASGEPGIKYWQNKADYFITCRLDTATRSVIGQVDLTYTNNSPEQLRFLWLQLDQNIYRRDSRGSATTTQAGGRWANAKFTEGQLINSVKVEYNGKTFKIGRAHV